MTLSFKMIIYYQMIYWNILGYCVLYSSVLFHSPDFDQYVVINLQTKTAFVILYICKLVQSLSHTTAQDYIYHQ